MNQDNSPRYAPIIRQEWRKLLVAMLVVVLIFLGITFTQPFLYRSSVSILVLQKSSFSLDAYSASKSEERIAQKLGQVVYSSSFLEKVLNSGYNVDRSYFPADEQARRKKWSQSIETSTPSGLSKLEIGVYHTDPNQAQRISQAVAAELTAQKADYIGIADVDLRLLDTPLVSKYPVKPNVILNIGLGIIVGLALGIVYIILSYSPHKKIVVDKPRQSTTYVPPVLPKKVMPPTPHPKVGLTPPDLKDWQNKKEEAHPPFKSVGPLPVAPIQEGGRATNTVRPVSPIKQYPEFKDEDEFKGMPR